MLRRYTVESYLEKLAHVRRAIPGIALSTDVIVGFPGETHEEYEATLELMRTVRFDDAYLYKYSLREGTPATRLPGRGFVAGCGSAAASRTAHRTAPLHPGRNQPRRSRPHHRSAHRTRRRAAPAMSSAAPTATRSSRSPATSPASANSPTCCFAQRAARPSQALKPSPHPHASHNYPGKFKPGKFKNKAQNHRGVGIGVRVGIGRRLFLSLFLSLLPCDSALA